MATTGSKNLSAITKAVKKFDGRNDEEWLEWRGSVEAFFLLEDMDGTLNTRERPQVPGHARNKWDKQCKQIHACLMLVTEGDARHSVEQHADTRNGVLAWHELCEKFEPAGHAGKVRLEEEMAALSLEGRKDPDGCFGPLENRRRQLAGLGKQKTDEDLMIMTLAKFPREYSVLKAILVREESLTYDKLKTEVRAFYREHIKEGAAAKKAEALFAGGAKATGFQGNCRGCGIKGHKP